MIKSEYKYSGFLLIFIQFWVYILCTVIKYIGGDLLKRLGIVLSIIIVLIFTTTSFAQDEIVFVIPIKGEINRATHNYVRDLVDDLNNRNDVEAIIFEIDTYGGLIEEAEKIKNVIVSTNIPTISYVNTRAASAGALITIASERVVVAPSASIGSAETVPNTEKILSHWKSVLRDTAQLRGRDSEIIEAMADSNIVIEGLSPAGSLLSLTSQESYEYGIADFVAADISEILTEFNLSSANVQVEEEGLQIKLAKYISSPFVSSLLLTIAFVGLVIEIFTPGFGVGGTISIIGFGLYFGGNILAGNSNSTSLVIFVIGLILLIIEGIVPGFGLPGISGIILILLGTVLAMDSVSMALLSLSIAIIITTIVTIVLVKRGFKSKILNRVILENRTDSERGFVSSDSMDKLLGKEGITLSGLRPSGYIEIEGQRLDALSEGGFIPKDTKVIVVKVEGSKIFVRGV